MTISGKSFNMFVEVRNLTWTLMLLFLSGALCQEWKVEYGQQHICAVNGSSVVILCSFYYPAEQKVHHVMWGHERHNIYDGPFIIDSRLSNNSSKFQYIGDKQHNCSFKIHQVEHDDKGKYTFRFITYSSGGLWTGKDGSKLNVVDLKVLVSKPNGNRITVEGDSVNLTCINGCDGNNLSSAFTWFKNGEPIKEGPVLYLNNMSFKNSGNYTCSLKTHTGTTSRVINMDVEYGPKNTSVSVSPSMEVDYGCNITMICSSHANPPVENYTWFKRDGDDHVMALGQESVFFSSGQYLCSATNKHGSQNSSVVTLRIKQYSATFNKDQQVNKVLIIATSTTIAVLLIVTTTVFAVRRLNKKRTRASEPDCEENTDYVNWAIFANNQSQEGNQREQATIELIYATVNFDNKRKTIMKQQMDSQNDDGSVIYSTVCRTQLLNSSFIEPR